ncbi:MAG: hypothetical protein ACIAQF_12965 [Phycisphaerales bacterium JB065]
MSASDHAAAFQSVIDYLKKTYEPAPAMTDLEPIRQLVYSFLLWDCYTNRADNAFKRIEETYVDMNDLRVSRAEEIMGVLGKTYPNAEERVARIKATLREIYLREHAVSLTSVREGGKREARKYVDSLEGMHPFVSARTCLLSMDCHAVPIEERLYAKLIKAGVFDEDTPLDKAQGTIERHVKASDGLETYLLLQAYSEDTEADGSELATKSSKGKKSTGRKTSTSSAADKPTSRKKKTAKS